MCELCEVLLCYCFQAVTKLFSFSTSLSKKKWKKEEENPKDLVLSLLHLFPHDTDCCASQVLKNKSLQMGNKSIILVIINSNPV